jgi:hypothetical protein
MIREAIKLAKAAFNFTTVCIEYAWVLTIATIEAFSEPMPVSSTTPEPIIESERPIEDPESYSARLERLTRESFKPRNVTGGNSKAYTRRYVPGGINDPHRKESE